MLRGGSSRGRSGAAVPVYSNLVQIILELLGADLAASDDGQDDSLAPKSVMNNLRRIFAVEIFV